MLSLLQDLRKQDPLYPCLFSFINPRNPLYAFKNLKKIAILKRGTNFSKNFSFDRL